MKVLKTSIEVKVHFNCDTVSAQVWLAQREMFAIRLFEDTQRVLTPNLVFWRKIDPIEKDEWRREAQKFMFDGEYDDEGYPRARTTA